MEKYYYSIDIPRGAKEESGDRISSYKKHCNIPMMIAAIGYFVALFLPIVAEPVMDAGPIDIPTLVFSLIMINAIGRVNDCQVLFIGLLFTMNLVMTASLLINTVTFAVSQKVKKAGRMFARNVFCFVMIPIFYTLAMYLFSLEYDLRFPGMARIGYFVILVAAVISLICFILISLYSLAEMAVKPRRDDYRLS